jgi:signal recognition particle receptor subunit beta
VKLTIAYLTLMEIALVVIGILKSIKRIIIVAISERSLIATEI